MYNQVLSRIKPAAAIILAVALTFIAFGVPPALAAPPNGAGPYNASGQPLALSCTGVLDDFEEPTPYVTVEVTQTSPADTNTQIGLAGALGGSRQVDLGPWTGSSSTGAVKANVSLDGRLYSSADQGASALVEVCYDTIEAGLNADLSTLDGFTLKFNSSDGGGFDASNPVATMEIDDGTNAATLSQNLPTYWPGVDTPFDVPFPLASFADIGAVNLANVQSICWSVAPALAHEYSLDAITCEQKPEQATDYGDAPDTGNSPSTGQGNYNTLATDNGPRHAIVAGLNLGSVAPDADPGTLQDVSATADDTTNTDDEDSIATLPTITSATTTVTLGVTARNTTDGAATLVCYIDFNRDGDFLDTGEASSQIAVGAGSGTASYAPVFGGFAAPVVGDSYIRCRIAYAASEAATPVGAAESGEVEDYKVTITGPNAVALRELQARWLSVGEWFTGWPRNWLQR